MRIYLVLVFLFLSEVNMPVYSVYISKDTDLFLRKETEYCIKRWSSHYGVDPDIIRAIVKVETNDIGVIPRLERHLNRAKWYTNVLNAEERLQAASYCSWGAMQILYGVAKSYGYDGTPYELNNPQHAVRFGIKHFKKQLDRYKGNVLDAVSSYNQGSNRKDKAGKYKNQDYVDKWNEHYIKMRSKKND